MNKGSLEATPVILRIDMASIDKVRASAPKSIATSAWRDRLATHFPNTTLGCFKMFMLDSIIRPRTRGSHAANNCDKNKRGSIFTKSDLARRTQLARRILITF